METYEKKLDHASVTTYSFRPSTNHRWVQGLFRGFSGVVGVVYFICWFWSSGIVLSMPTCRLDISSWREEVFRLWLLWCWLCSKRSAEKKKPFNCEFCEANFARKDYLQKHLALVHENKEPFKCDFCELTLHFNNYWKGMWLQFMKGKNLSNVTFVEPTFISFSKKWIQIKLKKFIYLSCKPHHSKIFCRPITTNDDLCELRRFIVSQ